MPIQSMPPTPVPFEGLKPGQKIEMIDLLKGTVEKQASDLHLAVGRPPVIRVNGDLVNHGFECTANQGQIAVQAEGSEVEFQKLMLTPITKLSETGK